MRILLQYLRDYGFIIPILLFFYLLNPFNLGYAPGLMLIPFLVLRRQFFSESLDFNLMVLTAFSITFASFYGLQAGDTQGVQFIAIYGLTPPVFYLLGKFLANGLRSHNSLFFLLFLIFTVFSLSAVISVYTNFMQEGFGTFDRNLPMFWSGRIVPATIMGAFMTFNMCIPATVLSRLGKDRPWTLAGMILLFVVSLICVLRLGSRTQLSIFLISTLVTLFYVVPRQSLRNNILLLGLLGGVVYFISQNISFDLSADWFTNFADRVDSRGGNLASGGGRTDRWILSLEYLLEKPLGWDTREFGHSHNMWLDVARVAGVIPFLLLLIFSFRALRVVRSFTRWNREDVALNNSVLIYTLAFVLIFMVEPIFDGIFSLFAVFCLFIGVLNQYPHRHEQIKEYYTSLETEAR